MDVLKEFFSGIGWEAVLFNVLHIVLMLVIVLTALFAARIGLNRLEQHLVKKGIAEGEVPTESSKRVETLILLLRQAVIIVVWIVAALVILREVGVEIGPVLASAGIAGLAIGFGAQNLVRDVISGFFIILENQVRIGDVAIVNGTGGLVEKINFRTIILRDLSGTVHVFPNGTITTLSNMTNEWSGYVMDIGVAYKEDIDKVIEVMKRVGSELRADAQFGPNLIDDLEIFGVDKFDDSAVVIKCRLKTRPIKQWETGREFRRRLKQAFDSEEIEIPFPHRTFYFGEASKPVVAKLLEDAKASNAENP